ncbi:MAG: alpha/beta hydrolase [Nitriliruptoraceae bacterium]|nr:alpha/beta hydrolase [Nitriliruptoraceae bacterium]
MSATTAPGHDHRITTDDGRELAARIFPGTTDELVVVAPAAGVPQRFYTGFATHVAAQGPTVLTFDYRGIGASQVGHARRDDARMRDWGPLDIEAVLQDARRQVDGRLLWVGQSAGGVYLPMAASRHLPARIVTVSSLSGYWRYMAPGSRWRLALGWYVAFPALMRVLGYAPSWLWGGTDLPAGVMRDWMRWCRDPDYFFGDPEVDTSGYDDLTAPILAVRASDDPWATPRSHSALHDRFTAAPVTRRSVTPAELGATRIGHIDLLRASVGAPFWPELLDWLLADGDELSPA